MKPMSSLNSPKTLSQTPTRIGLEAYSIFKSFSSGGKTLAVLDDINLNIQAGKIISVVGKSGVGKTTLLNIVSGLERPSSGTVSVRGVLGYNTQKDLLLPWRNISENILLPLEIKKTFTQSNVSQAGRFLREIGLEKFASAYPHEISGGMAQKVSLVRTFVQNPDVILFDEPFSAIDFDSRLLLVKSVRSWIVTSNKCALFVTHNIEEAISIADQVIVLGSRPAKIVLESLIEIPEENRDPVSVRKMKGFQELFEKIWKVMID